MHYSQDHSHISVLHHLHAAQASSDWVRTKSNMFEISCRALTAMVSSVFSPECVHITE